MTATRGVADPDDEDSLLRPAWEDSPDETDTDRGVYRNRPDPPRAPGHGAAVDDLLDPLCAATDALARLDARTAVAHPAVREGLIARMAYTEAAGFLAHTHAWVHPLDLALREQGLTASTALAATGAYQRALPQTFASTISVAAWANPPLDELPAGDAAVTEALALARALRRLVDQRHSSTLASTGMMAEALQALGTGVLNQEGLATWWIGILPRQESRRRRFGEPAGQGASPPLPPLLTAAHTAQSWIEAGPADARTPAQALWLAAGVMARTGAPHAMTLPVWTAYPALGFGDRDALPTLRSDAADRLMGWGASITWPLAFLHLVAESARMGLRELDRLEAAAEKGREFVARIDQRSRLPAAIDALLRAPVLTSTALAATLKVAPQTATALLRELQERGVVREVTGRERFRAYAI